VSLTKCVQVYVFLILIKLQRSVNNIYAVVVVVNGSSRCVDSSTITCHSYNKEQT